MKWTNTANLSANEIDETISYDETLGRTNLFTNGNFEFGTTYNFGKTLETTDPHSGTYYITQDHYSGWQSGEFVPVDTTREYQISVWAKTITRSAAGSLAGGHIGFSCYDSSKRFIDLRNCGGVGNTYLTRAASPGDTKIYIQSDSSWITGSDVTNHTYYYRHVLFFPASHPEYGVPHDYTRIGYGDYNIYYTSLVQLSANEHEMTLSAPLQDIGYSLPSGTPIARGVAGGTYNYAMGNPWYPETWTNYQATIPANNTHRNSGRYFRPRTKFIKFLILGNYNIRNEAGQKAKFALDDIAFVCTSQFQGNESNEAKKAIQGTNGTFYAQEFNEVGTGTNNGQLGKLSRGGEFTVNGQIIEQ